MTLNHSKITSQLFSFVQEEKCDLSYCMLPLYLYSPSQLHQNKMVISLHCKSNRWHWNVHKTLLHEHDALLDKRGPPNKLRKVLYQCYAQQEYGRLGSGNLVIIIDLIHDIFPCPQGTWINVMVMVIDRYYSLELELFLL